MKLTRREMLGATALTAVAGVGPRGLAAEAQTLRRWKPGEFQIHVIHTGVGESQFLIFPDGTTMLLDCGDHAALTRGDLAVPVVPNPGRLAGEWVARYVKRVNPQGDQVDYMETSHWHDDHCGTPKWQSVAPGVEWWRCNYCRSGFGLAAEQLHFKKAFDRNSPTFDDPIPMDATKLETTLGHMNRLYRHLEKRDGLTVERIRLGTRDQVVPVRGVTRDFSVFNLCVNGRVAMPDGSVVDCYEDLFKGGAKPASLNENAMSIGHIFTYGKFRYYTAGDFSDCLKRPDGTPWDIESIMARAVPSVDVAKMNHHGHWTMPSSLVSALRPRVWLACVWDQLHTVPATLNRLSDRSCYGGRKDVLICPGVFPEPRLTKERNAGYFRDLAPECFGKGCHVVVTVPAGGETFTVTFVTAEDESMRVTGERSFVHAG